MKKYIVRETQINELMEKLVGQSKMDLPIGKMHSMNKEGYSNDLISGKDSSMEQETQYYMFFQNLKQIKKQVDTLLKMDRQDIDSILQDGHDWASDHISTAKDDVEEVYNFLTTNHSEVLDNRKIDGDITEGKKKTGTKLCARGKARRQAKFKVYPSAYANGYAVQVCKGKMPGSDGKKHCSSPYC